MKYNLPVWNGLKLKNTSTTVKLLELKKGPVPGVFVRKDKNFINYEKNYTHMTPLKSGKYIKNLRDKKTDFVISHSINVGNCLEIGAGDDFNLKTLKSKKYTICDPFIRPKKKKKVKFINEYYENSNLKEKFDTIIMFSVLEHTQNFEKFLKKCKKNLKKKGKIFLSIPIIDSQFLKGDFNCLLHEHINYFSELGFFNLMDKFGFCINNYYIKNDSGFFCISHKKKKLDIKLKRKNINLKYVNKIFKKKIKDFSSFLKNNRTRKIIFYGATNGLNNLFFLANKTNKINFNNIVIVDSDSKKWKKRLSSCNKIIKNPNIIKNSDIVCITALSFLNEIKEMLNKNNQIMSLNSI